ncbi:bifunctional adenosylcobinamide kinase/adenosylcobinamide-phosphate guanylyltransferase [Loktanella sp. D2R18]|uniref:bifunctional adenosylcobinamide kinase/adenosylcobinamide-phosphate guanylyltransferase n=1 Tax=Rhodobacterales TaxID=204455 RepID=UPI000DE98A47|nr:MULTISPECIES: bifunctional adenosylcobinamide kinase/adenosylcobinamide-phosphate guanylyltransferase [Rhodobacterales]MDO6588728.1 bifunctional adenosylcobinamide kinase/adenosylcobinamide-phosphate guanylyltransferase [Yoonia sp. 1_MG-2023]RBW42036.1 bifunctional adenosylcobinamide kinase/adenosylcobinamide-phosphate guanylyltransferase [Loktanella sp. D2R18]
MLPKLTLVLGGAASGKSAFAESLVQDAGLRQIYVATAQVYDDEMAQKVVKHRDQRGSNWTTIEEPIAVADALSTATEDAIVLIDCATLWLTNLILGDHDVAQQTRALLDAIDACPAPIVIVSNEVGQGIVPDNALSRQFRNAQGRLNQDIAAKAGLVVAVMAGLPLALKGQLP